MSIKFQSSVFFVKDVGVSRRFYEGLLSQQVEMDFGPNVGFVGGFAIWQVDHACQTIFERAPGGMGQLGRENCEIYFETDDLDTVHAQLSEAGVEFAHPLREQPWGQRVFRFYDPDGHIVELGEPMPVVIQRFLTQGMSAEEISERTSMPIEIVQQIAKAKVS
ncbi:MAG: glyoxalase [Chloroflexi bacterium]|nr:glyoxalase [Chloroflexota bacterium]